MPVIPQANFNQDLSLGTKSKFFNTESAGLIGDAVEKVGDTALKVGLDIHNDIGNAKATEFAYQHSSQLKLDADKHLEDINMKIQSDGSLNVGDTLPDGTIIDSANPSDMIRKFQDKRISEVSKLARNDKDKALFESSVRNFTLANQIDAQGKQFKDSVKSSVAGAKNHGIKLATNAIERGKQTPFRENGSTTLDDTIGDLATYKKYLSNLTTHNMLSPKHAEELLVENAGLSLDNFYNSSMNQINSGVIGSDIEKIRYVQSLDRLVSIGDQNGLITPATSEKYRDGIAKAKLTIFTQKRDNLKTGLAEYMQGSVAAGKSNPETSQLFRESIMRLGVDDTHKARMLKNLELSNVAAEAIGGLELIKPTERKAFIENSLKEADRVSELLTKEMPLVAAGDPNFAFTNRQKLKDILTKKSDSLERAMLADPVLEGNRIHKKFFAADLEVMNDKRSPSEGGPSSASKRAATDHYIAEHKKLQMGSLGTPVGSRRSFTKEQVKEFAKEQIDSAKQVAIEGTDAFNSKFNTNYSKSARLEIMNQAYQDGLHTGGVRFDKLYMGVQYFPNSDSMNEMTKLVAGAKDINERWFKQSGKTKDDLDSLNKALMKRNQGFFGAMSASHLGVADTAMERAMGDIGKLYVQEKILGGETKDNAITAWGNELNKNYQRVYTPVEDNHSVANFIVPADRSVAPIAEWTRQHSDVAGVQQLLEDNNVPLVNGSKNYFEMASTIVSVGSIVGNGKSTGVRIVMPKGGPGSTKGFVLDSSNNFFEISFDSMEKQGASAIPENSNHNPNYPTPQAPAPQAPAPQAPAPSAPQAPIKFKPLSQEAVRKADENNPWAIDASANPEKLTQAQADAIDAKFARDSKKTLKHVGMKKFPGASNP